VNKRPRISRALYIDSPSIRKVCVVDHNPGDWGATGRLSGFSLIRLVDDYGAWRLGKESQCLSTQLMSRSLVTTHQRGRRKSRSLVTTHQRGRRKSRSPDGSVCRTMTLRCDRAQHGWARSFYRSPAPRDLLSLTSAAQRNCNACIPPRRRWCLHAAHSRIGKDGNQ
jgi:hypothetical protein